MENELREILLEWKEFNLPEIIEREVKFSPSEQIIAIVGPRRAGKTFSMFDLIKKLKRENTVYFNFEDYRIKNKGINLTDFLKTANELFEPKYFFLDEIQNLKDWNSFARTLHDKKFHVFISGSSSKLLSKEISTNLRGRYKNVFIFPFSFKEFLSFKKFELKKEFSEVKRGELLRNLREYLQFGGFPEVIKKGEKEEKIDYARTLFETIFYRDVIERFKIRNLSAADTFQKLLVSDFGSYFSISKTENYFNSIGIGISKKTISNYLKYFETTFFCLTFEKMSAKTKERVEQPKKIYSIDNIFYNLLPKFSHDFGKLMENLIAIEFYKMKFLNPLLEVYYWKDYQQREVDFVVKEGLKIKQLVQVTYASGKEDIKKREIENLLKAGKELRCNNLMVITWDYDKKEKINGKIIVYIPLWKWLLKS